MLPPKTANPNRRSYMDIINDPISESLDEKSGKRNCFVVFGTFQSRANPISVLFLRHKLQKGFLSRDASPAAAELPEYLSFSRSLKPPRLLSL
jgi:hypothetical protein